jgi:hypothetical protein
VTVRARILRHALLVGLFYFAVTVCFTYPLVLQPASMLRGGQGDYLTETSMVAWNAHQTFRDPARLFQVPFYYPYSNGVAYQQAAFFTGLLAAPLLAAGVHPVLATNLLLIAGLTASGAFTYLLAYTITGSVVPSLMAGAVFTFHPNRMEHLGQFTYQQAVLFPLIVWAVYRFVVGGATRYLCLAAVAFWAQALSSLYNGYALLILLGGLVVGLLVLRPARLTWSLVARVAVASVALGVALAPFLSLYEGDVFGMDLLSILDPGEWSRLYRHRLLSLGRPEGGLFPGFLALVLAAAPIVLHARIPGQPALPAWARRARWLFLGLAVAASGAIALALAIGKARPSLGVLRVLRIRDLTLAVSALPVLALGGLALEGRRRLVGALNPREWMLTLLFLALLAYQLCLAPALIVNGQPWGVTLFRWVYLYLPRRRCLPCPGPVESGVRASIRAPRGAGRPGGRRAPAASVESTGPRRYVGRPPRRAVSRGAPMAPALAHSRPVRLAPLRARRLRHPAAADPREGRRRVGHAVGDPPREACRERPRRVPAAQLGRSRDGGGGARS